MATALPVLLPANTSSFSQPSPFEWTPKKYKFTPQPPPVEDGRDLEVANAKLALDGKMIKKTRPRRTVDYNGGLGRWSIVSSKVLALDQINIEHLLQLRKTKPNASYVPYLRPSPPYVIDVCGAHKLAIERVFNVIRDLSCCRPKHIQIIPQRHSVQSLCTPQRTSCDVQ